MTGFMVVDGAAQHGLSINCTLLIFDSAHFLFPAYVCIFSFFSQPGQPLYLTLKL
jgi:hypothetical protein